MSVISSKDGLLSLFLSIAHVEVSINR